MKNFRKILYIAIFSALSLSSVNFAFAQNSSLEQQKAVEVFERDIKNIENYLNGITTFVTRFTQLAPDSSISYGTFYLSRPGKLRWEYDDPAPFLIVAKGSLISHYDTELDEVTHIGVDSTMATFLTKKNISFSNSNVKVIKFDKSDEFITITITETGEEDKGELTLAFSTGKIELKRMEVLDAVSNRTIIQFSSGVYGKPLAKDLFKTPKEKR